MPHCGRLASDIMSATDPTGTSFRDRRLQVTVTDCNEQSVISWLQPAQIADSVRVSTVPKAKRVACRLSCSACPATAA